MFYFYSISEKIYVEKSFPNLANPITNGQGVDFIVYQRYASMLLPFMPMTGKKVDVYTMGADQLINKKSWTPEIKQKAKELRSEARGTWKLFSFWYVLLSIILIAFVYTRTEMFFKKKKENEFVSYLNQPQAGDIIFAKVFPKDSQSVKIYPFKLLSISNDTLQVLQGDQNFESDYDVPRVMKKFDIDKIKYSDQPQIFNLSFYGGRHLQPFTREDSSYRLVEIVNVVR